jgi:two-component sensor histidine kinase
MQVISLLHQKLYKGATDSNIDMKIYVPELVNCIREGIDSDGRITYEVDVDNIELDISQAVPVGLIFNEAITNAIKYAYPDGQRGKIHVYLKSNEARLTLGVSDHGRGLPPGFDYHNVSSMGMKLIETLGEQLEGKVDLRSKNGTTLKIEFART